MKKNILITGSTDGIGRLAALRFAKEGHNIYFHGRNQTKLRRVLAEAKALANNLDIKGFVADFSEMTAVKQFAKQIANETPRIDILINNAGVFKSSNRTNSNGIDLRFAVNYLAPYVLTKELMPLLNESDAPRIINLSSAAQASVSSEALHGNAELSAQTSYAQSKLALTMWSFDLAKRHKNITVIALNPGSLLNTNMVKEAYGHHWSEAEKGSDIICDVAVLEEHSKRTGQYFDNDKGKYGKAHGDAYNDSLIGELIGLTDGILN